MRESIKDGGPAFPRPARAHGALVDGTNTVRQQDGMTLRDYFAAAALQGMLASQKHANSKHQDIVNSAVNVADMTLAALQKSAREQ